MKIIIKYLKRYILSYIIGVISLFGVDYVQIIIPKIIGNAVDDLREGKIDSNNLFTYVIILIALALVIFAGRFIWRFFIFGTSRKIEYHIRNDLFKHLEKLSLNFYNKNKTGDLMAHLTNDLSAVRMAIGPGLMMAFDAIVLTSMVIFKTIKDVSLPLTLIAIIPLPIISIGALLFGNILQKRFHEKQNAFAKLTDYVQESLSGIRIIKAFVQEANNLIKFNKTNKNNMDKNIRLIKIFSFMFPLVMVISGFSYMITLLYGGYLTLIGKITLGSFIAFIRYIGMLIWPLIALGWCINIFSMGNASLKRINKIFNEKPEITDHKNFIHIDTFNDCIKIKNLDFKYKNTKELQLKNISLKIKKGETVAIVGKTGCGKTTLLNLLVRLHNPKKHTIFIDDKDILRLKINDLRKLIGYVTQDNYLFSDTIKHNISISDDDDNLEKIINSAKYADFDKDIKNFDNKYETIIGERGVTLSGGQKQRLCIARTLHRNPEILIFDDSLSSVDINTEENIIENIKKIRKEKTNIIITHRLGGIQHVDNIFVLDDGKIVEKGNHFKLIKKRGIYYEMHKKQQLQRVIEETDV